MASYFWVGSISYSSWMPNKLGCRIMVIGSTPPVFLWFYSQLPLYKIWGGTSFFVSQIHWGTRAKNYEIHSGNIRHILALLLWLIHSFSFLFSLLFYKRIIRVYSGSGCIFW